LTVVRAVLERVMRIRGIVRTATLEEDPPGSDRIELVLRVQGVGPDQPRTLIISYELLLADPDIDPEVIPGKRFEAEVEQAEPGRWVVGEIAFASGQFLRRPEEP
jgi:hypothetical protein